MTTMIRLFALGLFALAAFPQSASATDYWHISTIKWIYPQGNGSVILTFNTDHASCVNVQSPKHYAVVVGQNGVAAEGLKNIYAAAIVAMTAGKQIAIRFSDTTDSCYINRVYVIN